MEEWRYISTHHKFGTGATSPGSIAPGKRATGVHQTADAEVKEKGKFLSMPGHEAGSLVTLF